MDGTEIAVGFGTKRSACIFCPCRNSGCSVHDYDAHTSLSHKQGSLDILFSEDARAIRRDGFQPIDTNIFCTDTSVAQGHLFHSGKSPFCYCISGSRFDTILP